MRVPTALCAVAAFGLADASPAKAPVCCSKVLKLVSKASISSQAANFCSSVLDITTVTRTAIPTITPKAITAVVTSTTTADTSTKTITDFTTEISKTTETTILAVETVTEVSTSTSITTISCFTGTTVLSSYPLPAETMKKRHQQVRPRPTPDCFRDWKQSAITSACKCLHLTRPTATVTSPTTIAARTTTSTFLVTVTPSTQRTTTVVVTEPSTTVATVTPSATTSTSTVTMVVETPALNGMQYFVYNNAHDYTQPGPGPDPASFQGGDYYLNGVIGDVDTVAFTDGVANFPDGQANGDQIAVKFEGFFYAQTAGQYTFFTPDTIDNQLTVWVGDIAYGQQTWTYANAAYDALRSGGDATQFRGGQVTLTLRAGEVVPFTLIFGNNSSVGALYFWVTMPDGTTVKTTANLFTPQCPGGPFTSSS